MDCLALLILPTSVNRARGLFLSVRSSHVQTVQKIRKHHLFKVRVHGKIFMNLIPDNFKPKYPLACVCKLVMALFLSLYVVTTIVYFGSKVLVFVIGTVTDILVARPREVR